MPDGQFHVIWDWRVEELRETLREALLRAFVRWERLHPESAHPRPRVPGMQTWEPERSGFGVFVGGVVPQEDRAGLQRLIRYLHRPPVALDRIDYDETSGKVRLRLNRGGVRDYSHAIELLADLSLHVPPPDHLVPA